MAKLEAIVVLPSACVELVISMVLRGLSVSIEFWIKCWRHSDKEHGYEDSCKEESEKSL